ncbi:MgtC/SapB family protein [Corynebacterium tuberculostearicum]|uniref:divisome protein SepX/GlpR n=1 Tax=Corynebacterium tuberculostearicum TaxID=38304 RepID=UPI0026662413|nr:gephyrin-like molybdotransferase receptor GlpR [Corynebacterium tuberculostearicum]WKE51639.1 MgtC/SapB family protein [Corynebacterium tuberculostearicum]
MSTAVPIIAIIVVWLFVLAPWLLGRNNRPMSHTGEAFEDTRVLFEGDSGKVAGRRRPRLRAGDVHRRDDEDEADYEVVEAADAADSESDAEATKSSSRSVTIAGAARRAKSQPFGSGSRAFTAASASTAGEESTQQAETIDGELVEEAVAEESESAVEPQAAAVPASQQADADKEANTAEADDVDDVLLEDEDDAADEATKDNASDVAASEAEVFSAPAVSSVANDAYAYDETFTSPVDLMYPGAVDKAEVNEDDSVDPASADEVDEAEGSEELAAAKEADETGMDTDLSEDEVEFAQRRLGRGGWDPVAEKEKSATRYQRRQRTLLGLAVAVVLTVALGIVVGGWTWWLAAVAGVLTVAYLVALRSQVRQEQALMRRRVRHLRRARLGVRNAEDEELKIPRNLRRPGAVVVEIDDESPDFVHLPLSYSDGEDGDFDGPHAGPDGYGRRDDLAARRAG